MKDIKKYSVRLVKEDKMEYTQDKIQSPLAGAELLNKVFQMDSQPTEIFVMLALDTKKQPIGCFLISQGCINMTVVSPRDVFQRALLVNAHSVIVAHNHPSGDINPSREDKKLTDSLKKAGDILGIEVLDNLVIGENGNYYSFLSNGEL